MPATSGVVRVDGFNAARDSLEVRKRVGYLPESTPLYGDMRLEDYLTYRAKIKQVPRRDVRSRVDYVIERTLLGDRRRQIVDTLSKGLKQRVGIADALVGNPKLLILDEPTIGLDPKQIQQVRELIQQLGETHTILISTHILVEVEMVCDRVVIVARGKTVADDTVSGLLDQHREHASRVTVRADCAESDFVTGLQGIDGVVGARAEGGGDGLRSARVEFAPERGGAAAEAVAALCAERGWALRELAPVQTTLEQVFNRLTEGELEPVAPADAPSKEAV